jgi:23S rRNA pseudouridine1911/1915/1917 synthase
LPTKSSVKKAIAKKLIIVDGHPCETSLFVKHGQEITLQKEVFNSKEYKTELDIVFEDGHIALINKPAGIPVSGNTFKTIQNALTFNLKRSYEEDALDIPLPVHRLDAQTSGLLIIAKTTSARIELGRQFEAKEVRKKYNAVVIGLAPVDGSINLPIEEKDALSDFYLLRVEPSHKFEYLSLLELIPHTGRTHQLRIHCKESGFPVLGDSLYSVEGMELKAKGLFLSSVRVSFVHPFTKEKLSFEIPPPEKFNKFMLHEKKRYIMNLT